MSEFPNKETQFSSTNQPPKSLVGRKKGSKSLTTILRDYMDMELDVKDPITKEYVKKRVGDIINLKIIAKALKGEDKSLQLVFDRLEGKPHQSIDQTIKAEMTMSDLIKNVEKDKK